MFKALRIRFLIMGSLVFLAFFFNPNGPEFIWEIQTGICNEYDFVNIECLTGENLFKFPKFVALIDLPTLVFIWVFIFCGSYFNFGNLIDKLERASHLSKDAGELCACTEALLIFSGVFHEAGMAVAFKAIFQAYLYGHFTAIILSTMANYLKSKEDENTIVNNSIMPSSA